MQAACCKNLLLLLEYLVIDCATS